MTNKIIEIVKNFVLNTLGHAVSGAGVGIIYELQQLATSGVALDKTTILIAVGIGGSLGFFKTIVQEIEKLKKTTSAKAGISIRTRMGF